MLKLFASPYGRRQRRRTHTTHTRFNGRDGSPRQCSSESEPTLACASTTRFVKGMHWTGFWNHFLGKLWPAGLAICLYHRLPLYTRRHATTTCSACMLLYSLHTGYGSSSMPPSPRPPPPFGAFHVPLLLAARATRACLHLTSTAALLAAGVVRPASYHPTFQRTTHASHATPYIGQLDVGTGGDIPAYGTPRMFPGFTWCSKWREKKRGETPSLRP